MSVDLEKLRSQIEAEASKRGLTMFDSWIEPSGDGYSAILRTRQKCPMSEAGQKAAMAEASDFHVEAFRMCRDGKRTVVRRSFWVKVHRDFGTDIEHLVSGHRFHWLDEPGDVATIDSRADSEPRMLWLPA